MQGSCHCGAITFEAPGPTELTECNCSFCDRVGALWAYCAPEGFALTGDLAGVVTYRFGSEVVEHFHCPACGCATHQRSLGFSETGKRDFDHPKMGYNVQMMPDVDRAAIKVLQLDGKNY